MRPSPILTPQHSTRVLDPRHLKPLAAALLVGTGIALLLGTTIDFGVLWIVQHQDSSQWEFASLATTLDNYSLILVGITAFAAGLYLRDLPSPWGARIVIALCFVFAALALLGIFLLGTDYFDLHTKLEGATETAFNAALAKGIALAVIYSVTLIVGGVRGLQRR